MVQVKEGYISKADLKIIKQQVVDNNNFPWYYYPEPVYGFQKNYPCLSHILLPRYDYENNIGFKINSELYSFFTGIIEKICKKHKVRERFCFIFSSRL